MKVKFVWLVLAVILLVVILRPRPADKPLGAQKPVRDVEAKADASDSANTMAVVARGVSVVPGAIVCPDFPTLKLMFSLYTEWWSENAQNRLTNGLSSAIDGPPASTPDFEGNGCVLLPSGTPMRLEHSGTVNAKLSDGRTISGVTLPSMVDYPPEVRRKKQELQQAEGQRYDQIMQSEVEQHDAALKKEHDRRLLVMRQLNPHYIEASPESGMDCIEANCQEESNRYAAAVRQENALFLSRSQDAWQQARQRNDP